MTLAVPAYSFSKGGVILFPTYGEPDVVYMGTVAHLSSTTQVRKVFKENANHPLGAVVDLWNMVS